MKTDEKLREVVNKLGEVADELTFIGGSTIGLYLTEPEVVKIRATLDVDTVVEVATLQDYENLRRKLRKKGFSERPESQVMCRFFSGELVLDVMPDDEKVLGFSNRWYKPALKACVKFKVADREINAFSSVYLLATKMSAFLGRGKGDFFGSHDIEDIVNLFDGRSGLIDEIAREKSEAGDWVRATLRMWLSKSDFAQAVEGHISDFQNSGGRRAIVIDRMTRASSN